VRLPPLGLSLPLAGVDPRSAVEVARAAQDQGYESCWVAEIQGPDAFTTLGALAVATDLHLGVAVVPVQTRTAFVLGMTAVSLAQLSGGRFTLGVGPSSEVIVDRWAGQSFARPLTAVREMVEALGPLLAGQRSAYDGEVVRVGGFQTHAVPPGGRVPLVLGALNPRSCRLVGELGVDGLCVNQVAPWHLPAMLDHVARGAGGTMPEQFTVMARLFGAVTDDVPAARAAAKATFAPYIATSVYNRFYTWMGYDDEARAVLTAAAARDRDAMTAAVSDRIVDDLFCLGTADEVAEKIAAFCDAGVTVPVFHPLTASGEQAESMLGALAEAWR